jgi:membrane protease YdiL (CAAX protease family)
VVQTKIDNQYGIWKQVLLHLVPGVLTAVAYYFLASYFHEHGLPSLLGFFAATILVLFPLEIGLPVVLERKKQGKIDLKDIFIFREKQPGWQIVLLALGALLWAGVVFMVGGSALVDPIREGLFGWVPDWLDLADYVINGQAFSRTTRIVTWALGIVFGAILGPIIEEFYFRSYLLPRMSWLKAWAPLVGTVLMSLYHFWSPWLFVVRVIAMLPMVYAVWWKKNVHIGILAHCLLNLIGDSLMAIPLVFG